MGVSFGRPYQDILEELTNAIGLIPDGYTFFEMTEGDWAELGQAERKEVLEALADDVFYGLGEDRLLFIGSGSVQYDPQFHTIEIVVESDTVATISLI
ncbi:hypothetical protein [Paenibacillus alvei]|uniref:Uncharacterized protein n=1 Tax=Paenibacillus alvei TaxID=44250 RepID=A0AAP7DJ75_PAEAL|nr:hypothetical protein [Paenibacillus alvei]MBG9732745.1 hypothetical protein [Paenibacillus alvei]MBG9744186.1 hypothetical protein [Paenibacillus alvei]MCY9580249.1 hypothetical protein [Paenibacillus alvei]MCY9588122.1 hypothetical protein [Paenibacillus alvei]NEZ43641.1 hypothetical protein [Paenibacillus alvei]